MRNHIWDDPITRKELIQDTGLRVIAMACMMALTAVVTSDAAHAKGGGGHASGHSSAHVSESFHATESTHITEEPSVSHPTEETPHVVAPSYHYRYYDSLWWFQHDPCEDSNANENNDCTRNP